MSEINWDAVRDSAKSAVADILTDAQNGHYDVVKVTPQPDPATPPPAVPQGGTNPYGSHSGIEGTDNPYSAPVRTVPEKDVQTVIDALSGNGVSTPESKGLLVVGKAMLQQGKRYGWGATGPDTWDCSALTQWAYKEALGIILPRTTYDQVKQGREVKFSEAIDGDLIFSNFSERGPEHVSINMSGPDNVFEAGDPVGIYKWGNRGRVIVKRYT